MHPKDQLGYILPTLSSVVERIQASQLDDPTPCTAFTVHDLLDHLMVLDGTFANRFRGEEAVEFEPPARVHGWVPSSEFRKIMDDLLDAVKSTGAMDRTIAGPWGERSGETFARFLAFDGLMHGWDLRRATGVRFEVPPAVIAAADAFARVVLTDDLRATGAFAAEVPVPEGASPIDSLAAFSGRAI